MLGEKERLGVSLLLPKERKPESTLGAVERVELRMPLLPKLSALPVEEL